MPDPVVGAMSALGAQVPRGMWPAYIAWKQVLGVGAGLAPGKRRYDCLLNMLKVILKVNCFKLGFDHTCF